MKGGGKDVPFLTWALSGENKTLPWNGKLLFLSHLVLKIALLTWSG